MSRGNFAYGGIQRSYSFEYVLAGQIIAPDTGRHQLPNIACEMVFIKADPDNTGNIWIGGDQNLTSENGFQLAADDPLPYAPVTNLNKLWYVASAANQRLHYILFR